MNRQAIGYLVKAFGLPEEKIVYIPHGAPGPSSEERQSLRSRLGFHGRKVMFTFGLLSRGKGTSVDVYGASGLPYWKCRLGLV